MGTKTIGLDEEAYERLKAEKREDESFSDVVKRVTAEIHSDWRRGFGKYDGERGVRLVEAAVTVRDRRRDAGAARRQAVVDALAEEGGERDNAVRSDEGDGAVGNDEGDDGARSDET